MAIRFDGILLKLFTIGAALSIFLLVGCPTYVDVEPSDRDSDKDRETGLLESQAQPSAGLEPEGTPTKRRPDADQPSAVRFRETLAASAAPIESATCTADSDDPDDGTAIRIPDTDRTDSASLPDQGLPSPADGDTLPAPPFSHPDQPAVLLRDSRPQAAARAMTANTATPANENPLRHGASNSYPGQGNRLRGNSEESERSPEAFDPVAAVPLPGEDSTVPEPPANMDSTVPRDAEGDSLANIGVDPNDGATDNLMENPENAPMISANGPDSVSVRPPQKTEPEAPWADRGSAVDPEKVAEMIRRNGPIFVGWKKPEVVFLFTGELNGYIEPCGCAGLDNQKGGLSRRFSLIQQLRGRGWPVVPLDLGGQVKRFGPQAEIKFRHIVESLVGLRYPAVGLGPNDLRLEVLPLAAELDSKNPFLSANVALGGFDTGFTRQFLVVEEGGYRIGITSILGNEHHQGLQNSIDVQVTDMEAALREIVPQLDSANCDIRILLSHASPQVSISLGKRFPVFDFVVTAGGFDEPPDHMRPIEGTRTQLVEVGQKGMYVSVVGVFDDPQNPVRFDRVPLDARFPASKEMQMMMVRYQKDLKTLGLEGLQVKAVPRGDGGRYAGTAMCVDCHSEANEIFQETTHAHAFDTLVELEPSRQYDPECISCHVTGWDPQKYFPYKSGYLDQESTPHLLHNGCENCHGPGWEHATAENRASEVPAEVLERYRAALRLKIVDNEGNQSGQKTDGAVVQMCIACHDQDNSPDFDFQEYWPEVEHHGKE